MKRIFLFFIILIFCAFRGTAQNTSFNNSKDTTNTSLLGFFGIINAPTTDFEMAGYSSGGGAGLEWFSKKIFPSSTSGINVRLGISMFYAGQGSVDNSVLLHDPFKAPGTQSLHNNLFGMDFRFKLIKDKNIVRPYGEAFIGFRSFTTRQTLSINYPIVGYQTRTQTLINDDVVNSFGASVGCMIKLSENAFFDFKVSYTGSNSSVNFVDFNHLRYDGFMYNSNGFSNSPSLISYQLGFLFKLKSNPSSGTYRSTSYYSSGSGYSSRPYYRDSYNSTYRSTYHPSYNRSCGRSSGGGKPLR